MAEHNFQNAVEALFKGMDGFISTKTVVGDAVKAGDTILLPLVDVSFGVAAGAFADNAKNNGGGGMGAKISPTAVLVISKNGTKMINVKSPDAMSKLIDMIPELADKFAGKGKKDECSVEEVEHIINQDK